MTVAGAVASALGWLAFYGGVGAVLALAHYGMEPAERLSGRAAVGVALATGVLPWLVLPAGPASAVVLTGGVFAAVRSLLGLVALFVGGAVFGLFGFIAYVVVSDPHDGSAYW